MLVRHRDLFDADRSLTRIVVGIGLIGNGANLLLVVAGSRPGVPPIVGRLTGATDPIPQALVLTAIVIGFALQAFLLALAWRSWTLDGNDDVEDDVEDRRLADERRRRIRMDEAARRAERERALERRRQRRRRGRGRNPLGRPAEAAVSRLVPLPSCCLSSARPSRCWSARRARRSAPSASPC